MPYETIFNQTYDFTGLLDSSGTILEANDRALEFGGLTREHVIGEKLWETAWISWSRRVTQQVRADIWRAADNEFVRHEMTVQGADERAVIDFSITPLTDNNGDVTRLLIEGRDVSQLNDNGSRAPRIPPRISADNLLVSYSRDADQPMSDAVIDAFRALDVDIFETDTQLEDWINTDALDEFAWRVDRPLALMTRIWGYNVVFDGSEIRIHADS